MTKLMRGAATDAMQTIQSEMFDVELKARLWKTCGVPEIEAEFIALCNELATARMKIAKRAENFKRRGNHDADRRTDDASG